ncbi:MAG: BACON domain-containing protein, partial [Planctomycetes bacterium]|nr:BACON domain-containing protein [Planctomycetota bacterium]
RSQLVFGGSTSGVTDGTQTFSISNAGQGTLNWSIGDNAGWLSCTPTSGTGSAVISVSVNVSGLSAGTYTGTVTVSSSNASNSPRTVAVTLNVYSAGSSGVPFGDYATPVNGSTVRSSVPFTGWALDDIGVESVKIYRGNQDGSSLVYIGDAVFVEGARPDVEQAYPGYPMNYRAGWGYMMLTNFLPNSGNGIFTIFAIAGDKEGHRVTLGAKTVTCDNANAVKPFGAIDTPLQGGTASGTAYRNWGWVLTPMPNKIPTDGSTISVFVDGVDLGHPLYNFYRSDIAGLFPGYANSSGAAAYFDFDTTAYENGVHTIAWHAADNAGNTDGIGSRYFSIQNSQGAKGKGNPARSPGRIPGISNIPVDYLSPVEVIKGFNRNVIPQKYYMGENGFIDVEIKELERIKIHIDGNSKFKIQNSKFYSGFQLVGNERRPLPTGSTMDRERGIFYWQPGPGFIG